MSLKQCPFRVLFLLLIFGFTTQVSSGSEEGIIEEWLVLGVFSYQQGQERLAVDFLGGEHDVAPYEGAATSGKEWKVMHTDHRGKLDFITAGDFEDSHIHSPKICLVSCAIDTHVHDLMLWIQEGYIPMFLRAFDMFPFTEFIETVTLLNREK